MRFDELYNKIIEEQKSGCNIKANELKKGDEVRNINPDCIHSGTKGVITKIKNNKGKGGISGRTVFYKVKQDPKHKGRYAGKEIEKTEIQLAKQTVEKTIHDPVRPGILKRAAGGGKLSCSKAKAVKARQKNKGNNTAKAAQRYLNYHC